MAAVIPQGGKISLRELLNQKSPDVPTLDLGWAPVKARLAVFCHSIDKYALSAHQSINEWAADHVSHVRQLKDTQFQIEGQIAEEREEEGNMLAELQEERNTMQALNSTLTKLRSHLNTVREESSQLESELQAIKSQVMKERAEKERQGKTLGVMKNRDDLELKELQDAVGWKIEGSGQDQLLMRFTLIDPSNPEREFMIVIDISKFDYSVTKISPSLPNLSELLRDLNEDRDFTRFIKRVRKGFKSLCTPSEQVSRLDLISGATRTPARRELGTGADVEDALVGLSLDPKA